MVFSDFSKSSVSRSTSKIDEAKLSHMIRERAYYIWERKGKPAGRDLTIWLQAEREIRARLK